jgi:Icc-related predicted phosphoesterase
MKENTMKILAGADIHGAQYRLNLILENIEHYHPDLVIICGDITQFGPGDVAKNFLNQLPVETLALQGNIDTADVPLAIQESKATYLHMKKHVTHGLSFVGVSGVNPSETELFFTDGEKKNWITKDTVLVSHVPPKGYQDRVFFGMHSGSQELRRIVDTYHPQLVLCGHIHEDPGITKTKETMIVNCSLGKRGSGALVTVGTPLKVDMLD